MTFNSDEQRDKSGKWTSGSTDSARNAVDWLKSGEAKTIISKITAPEHVKAAATFAIQSMLFQVAGINDSGIDAMVKYKVHALASDLKTTNAHARQVALTVVRALIKDRS